MPDRRIDRRSSPVCQSHRTRLARCRGDQAFGCQGHQVVPSGGHRLPPEGLGQLSVTGCSPFLLGASQMAKNLNLDRGRSKGHVGTYTTQMYGISSNKTASFRQTFSRMPCPSHVAFPWRPEGGWVCEWLRPKYGASPGLLKGADGIQVVCTRGPDGDGVPH